MNYLQMLNSMLYECYVCSVIRDLGSFMCNNCRMFFFSFPNIFIISFCEMRHFPFLSLMLDFIRLYILVISPHFIIIISITLFI
ncbi:hypothetical protein CW304_23700 [Bacillus sp. UFRGS-B20]|nr:hypothetical protein CW304_23700 [Bacillus sp. UFRGS-B20]